MYILPGRHVPPLDDMTQNHSAYVDRGRPAVVEGRFLQQVTCVLGLVAAQSTLYV